VEPGRRGKVEKSRVEIKTGENNDGVRSSTVRMAFARLFFFRLNHLGMNRLFVSDDNDGGEDSLPGNGMSGDKLKYLDPVDARRLDMETAVLMQVIY
jgi:hypothetical protein